MDAWNGTNASASLEEPSTLEEMDLGLRVFWDVCFVSIITVGIVGNLIVLWIIMGTKNILFNFL